MNILGIVGSSRKGKTTDVLVDKAIEGAKSKNADGEVKKIYLADHNIQFCTDCLSCWKNVKAEPYAKCTIRDDMDSIYEELVKADRLIFGTPVHMGYASAIMMTFLERICWPFARPAKRILNIKGLPDPRVKKDRKAIIIAVAGLIPPVYKRFCNWATPQIEGVISYTLNAKTIGKLYAGGVWHRDLTAYSTRSFELGAKLCKR